MIMTRRRNDMAVTPSVAHRDYELPLLLSGSGPNKLTCGVDDVPRDLEPRFNVWDTTPFP